MANERDNTIQSAERLLRQGRVKAALSQLEQITQRNPKDLPTLNRVGDLLARQGRHPEAIGYYRKIAGEFTSSGFVPKAVAIYKKILRLDAKHEESLLELGSLFLKQKLYGEARGYLLKAADLFLQRDELPRAREVYERLVAAEPNDPRHRVRLAEAWAAEGENERAVGQLLDLAATLLDRGSPDEAEQTYRRVVELEPDNALAVAGIVACLRHRGDHAGAQRFAHGEGRAREAHPAVVGQLALSDLEAGRIDTAIDVLFGGEIEGVPETVYVEAFARARTKGLEDRLWERFDAGLAGRRPGEGSVALLERLASEGETGNVPALQRLLELRKSLDDRDATANVLERLVRAYEARSMNDEASLMREQLREVHPGSTLLATRGAGPPAPAGPAGPTGPSNGATSAATDASPGAGGEVEAAAAAAAVPDSAGAPDAGEDEHRRAEAPAVPLNRNDEEFVAGRLTQAEILEKYGLLDQALAQLTEVAARFPGHVEGQQRRVALLQEQGAIGGLRDALVDLALALRASGDTEGAREAVQRAARTAPLRPATRALLQRFGLEEVRAPARPAAQAPPPGETGKAAPDDESDVLIDFDDAPRAPKAPEVEPREAGIPLAEVPAEEVPEATLTAAPDSAPADTPPEPEAPPAAPADVPFPAALDDDDLSAITAALESDVFHGESTEPATPEAESEESIEEVFAAFRRRVNEQVDREDHRTHYDLGIAYKEMGLVDEAIEEFQLASRAAGDSGGDALNMIALCHKEKGDMAQAAHWYREALGASKAGAASQRDLRYDLADVLLQSGDAQGALDLFRHVLHEDPSYRDVRNRVSDLESRLRS